jgi:cytochrome c556
MRSLFCAAGVLAVLVVAGLLSGPAGATIDDEALSIKKVMKKLNSGNTAPIAKVKAALKGESPAWADVQKEAKVISTLTADLPKNDPPRGEKDSYDKLANAFASAAKTLEESAEKEDLAGSRAALKKITTSCMPCHQSHKSK